jgi:hypothetical protein
MCEDLVVNWSIVGDLWLERAINQNEQTYHKMVTSKKNKIILPAGPNLFSIREVARVEKILKNWQCC